MASLHHLKREQTCEKTVHPPPPRVLDPSCECIRGRAVTRQPGAGPASTIRLMPALAAIRRMPVVRVDTTLCKYASVRRAADGEEEDNIPGEEVPNDFSIQWTGSRRGWCILYGVPCPDMVPSTSIRALPSSGLALHALSALGLGPLAGSRTRDNDGLEHDRIHDRQPRVIVRRGIA